MPFNDKQKELFLNFIKNNKINEVEIRFGEFNNKRFDPMTITKEQFDRVFIYVKGFAKFSNETTDIIKIYKEYKQVNDVFMTKEKIYVLDNYNYNFRVSFSKEKEILDGGGKKEEPIIIYKRQRFSFIYNNLRYDLSIYDENKYNIEIEILSISSVYYVNLINDIDNIIAAIQNCSNKNIISNYERCNILKEYERLTKTNKFIGVNVQVINKKNYNQQFAVTKKIDGERMLLFICNRLCYLIDKHMNIKKTGNFIKQNDIYLYDGEYYNNSYYIFDIIYNNGNTINLSFLERLDLMYKNFILFNGDFSFFKIKKYYLNKIDFEKSEGIDGYIFQPIKDKYSIFPPLKYKFDNTIDFKVVNDNIDTGYMNLMVYNENNNDIPFPIKEYSKIEKAIYNLNNGMVYEFSFDKKQKQFIPIRCRLDKIRGNYITVALDNFTNDFDINIIDKQIEIDYNSYNDIRFIDYVKRFILFEFINQCNDEHLSIMVKDLNELQLQRYLDLNFREIYSNCYIDLSKINKDPLYKNFTIDIYKQQNVDVMVDFSYDFLNSCKSNIKYKYVIGFGKSNKEYTFIKKTFTIIKLIRFNTILLEWQTKCYNNHLLNKNKFDNYFVFILKI